MQSFATILALKVVSFLGATLSTVGFMAFFFFEALEPYRWHMFLGGIAIIALGELAAYFAAKHFLAKLEVGVEGGGT